MSKVLPELCDLCTAVERKKYEITDSRMRDLLNDCYIVRLDITSDNADKYQHATLHKLLQKYNTLLQQQHSEYHNHTDMQLLATVCELLHILMYMDKVLISSQHNINIIDMTIASIQCIDMIVSLYYNTAQYQRTYQKQCIIVLTYITSRQRRSLLQVVDILFKLLCEEHFVDTLNVQAGILYNVVQNNPLLIQIMMQQAAYYKVLTQLLYDVTCSDNQHQFVDTCNLYVNQLTSQHNHMADLYIDVTGCILLHCVVYYEDTINFMILKLLQHEQQYMYCMLVEATADTQSIHIPTAGLHTVQSVANTLRTVEHIQFMIACLNEIANTVTYTIIQQAVTLIGNLLLQIYTARHNRDEQIPVSDMLSKLISHKFIQSLIELLNYFDTNTTDIPIKTSTMRCIALITYFSTESRTILYIDTNSINTILSQSKLSDTDPTLKQWMLLTVRNITQYQPIADYITSLKPVSIANTDELHDMNINVELDERTGKVRVRNNESAELHAAVRAAADELSSFNGLSINDDEKDIFNENDFM